MQGKFYQACYTRVGVNEGWKTLHYSTDIPQVLLAAYEKNEAGNEVKRGTPLDKNGHSMVCLTPLDVLIFSVTGICFPMLMNC